MVGAGLGVGVLPEGSVVPYAHAAPFSVVEVDEPWSLRPLLIIARNFATLPFPHACWSITSNNGRRLDRRYRRGTASPIRRKLERGDATPPSFPPHSQSLTCIPSTNRGAPSTTKRAAIVPTGGRARRAPSRPK